MTTFMDSKETILICSLIKERLALYEINDKEQIERIFEIEGAAELCDVDLIYKSDHGCFRSVTEAI